MTWAMRPAPTTPTFSLAGVEVLMGADGFASVEVSMGCLRSGETANQARRWGRARG